MRFFGVSLGPVLLAIAGALFSAQAGYTLLSLDNHYTKVREQVQRWCDTARGCSVVRLTGTVAQPEITVHYRDRIRDRAALTERVRSELTKKELLTLGDGVAVRLIAIRVDD